MADFNEELARATLLERPNSFFVGTAAPEDVDSDSGYSSPQHRQTTAAPNDSAAASAAAAAAAPVVVGPPPVVVPACPQPASRILETAQTVQQPALVTCLPDGRHVPMIYASYPFQAPPPVNMFLPPGPNVISDTPRPLSANCHGNGAKMRYRGGSFGNRKASKQQASVSKSPTNGQPTCASAEVSSQVVACSEPALPFDDVDEFPYLLSAADGLVASQVSSGPPPPSQLLTCRPVEVIKVIYFLHCCNTLASLLCLCLCSGPGQYKLCAFPDRLCT